MENENQRLIICRKTESYRVRHTTFLVPSTEELTRRRRDWYDTDRKTTELVWRWPEVNRKLPNSFECKSNSLELSWIHFESYGITWYNWNFLEIFGIGLELFGKFWNHLNVYQFGQNWNGIKLHNCKLFESWSNLMEYCPRR